MMDTIELIDMVLKYLIIPVGGWAAVQFSKLTTKLAQHSTELAVLQAQIAITKASHEREMSEIKDMNKRIFDKLDDIEGALRK